MNRKKKSGSGKLIEAINRRDAGALKKLLEEGAEPNEAKDSDYIKNVTPLMLAAGIQFAEGVEILLNAGADPNIRTVAGAGAGGGGTALHNAIHGSNVRLAVQIPEERIKIVKLLLKASADPNAVDQETKLPLFYAASAGNYEISSLLIESGAEVKSWPAGCVPPLVGGVFAVPPHSVASGEPHLKVVNLLLEKGAPLDCEDTSGATALMAAATRSNEPLVNLFLDRGADVNHRAKDGRTPLLCVARYARFARAESEHQLALRIVKRLIEAGADVHAKNADGETAFDIASKSDKPLVADCIRGLIEKA